MISHRSRCALSLLMIALLGACSAPQAAPVTMAPATVAPTTAPTPTSPPTASPAPTSRPAATPAASPEAKANAMTLVGALALDARSKQGFADIAVYNELAFIGNAYPDCREYVSIIDISDPAAPALLGQSPELPNVAMADMEALRIGERDVLAIALEDCDQHVATALDLIDISDPRRPTRLSTFDLAVVEGVHGVHEFDLTVTPDGRTLALLAVPELERLTANPDRRGGTGDLLIVDISDPTRPTQIAEWGLLDAPELGPAVFNEVMQGGEPLIYLHSVRASADGTRAFLSYMDAGVIILDIADPAAPGYLGRTEFGAADEGNAHSVAISPDERLLVEADEDFAPKPLAITSNAFAGPRAVFAHIPTAKAPTGGVAHAGRGCPAGTVAGQPADDPYTQEVSGTIALLDPGGCRPEEKVARAALAGAVGVVLYGGDTFSESGEVLKGDIVKLPGGEILRPNIPVLLTSYRTAQDLIAAGEGATIKFTSSFDGWGGLRLFDISDPQRPRRLGGFRTANSDNPKHPESQTRFWSAHNPEFRDDGMLFASWYADGVRAIDISDPTAPREVGFWAGEGAPTDAPPVDIWGIALHGDLVLASDRSFGLYILRMQP